MYYPPHPIFMNYLQRAEANCVRLEEAAVLMIGTQQRELQHLTLQQEVQQELLAQLDQLREQMKELQEQQKAMMQQQALMQQQQEALHQQHLQMKAWMAKELAKQERAAEDCKQA